MSVDIRRLAPLIAAVLSLAGVGVASTFQPESLPTCPSRNTQVTVPRKNIGTVPVTCKPAKTAKGGQD